MMEFEILQTCLVPGSPGVEISGQLVRISSDPIKLSWEEKTNKTAMVRTSRSTPEPSSLLCRLATPRSFAWASSQFRR